jgi:protein gp37
MNNTAIVWTEATWNPMSGCTEVSEGCKFCYAKTIAEQKRGTAAFRSGFDLTIRPHKLTEPTKLSQPSLIFVNSMSDLFWDQIPTPYRDQIIDVMESTPQHQYQVLTKRPEAMRDYSRRRPLPGNVWAGTTIENDRVAWRADVLRQVNAQVRFISAEPLLSSLRSLALHRIDWLISGGESGSHLSDPATRARRGLVERGASNRWEATDRGLRWVRDLRDRCLANRVAFFHKQWGGPKAHSGGRLLDGRTWDEFPRYPEGGAWLNRHAAALPVFDLAAAVA